MTCSKLKPSVGSRRQIDRPLADSLCLNSISSSFARLFSYHRFYHFFYWQ